MLILEVPEEEVSVVLGGDFDVAGGGVELRQLHAEPGAILPRLVLVLAECLPSVHLHGRHILRQPWKIVNIVVCRGFRLLSNGKCRPE